jgi:DmsE family decaheme c-type cytochrome
VVEGLIECADCHDPHGTIGEDPSRASHRQDSLCANCHTETAGPFVFPHAVMKTEGCTACHFPHGGPNPHLLRRSDVDAICQQCHLPAPDPKTGAHIRSANNPARPSQSCIDCHTDVHGSNCSIVFLKKK